MGTAAAPTTARVVRLHSTGGPEVLKIETEPIPEPGRGEVRLRVKAIGLNRAEVMFREGRYLETPAFPAKLGYEAAGVVEAVGADVDKSWLGKKVSSMPVFVMTKYGVYGEVAIVPVRAIAVYPERLTPEEGTSIWMQYLTAYGALVEFAKVTKGDFVVLTAASSSVGIAARSDEHRHDANREKETSTDRGRREARNRDRRGGLPRAGEGNNRREGPSHHFRSDWRKGNRTARTGGSLSGDNLRIWSARSRADAVPLVCRPRQRLDRPRVHGA